MNVATAKLPDREAIRTSLHATGAHTLVLTDEHKKLLSAAFSDHPAFVNARADDLVWWSTIESFGVIWYQHDASGSSTDIVMGVALVADRAQRIAWHGNLVVEGNDLCVRLRNAAEPATYKLCTIVE